MHAYTPLPAAPSTGTRGSLAYKRPLAPSGRSRCFADWQEFMQCYSKAERPTECINQRADYLECLHHTKEVSRRAGLVREGGSAGDRLRLLSGLAGRCILGLKSRQHQGSWRVAEVVGVSGKATERRGLSRQLFGFAGRSYMRAYMRRGSELVIALSPLTKLHL